MFAASLWCLPHVSTEVCAQRPKSATSVCPFLAIESTRPCFHHWFKGQNFQLPSVQGECIPTGVLESQTVQVAGQGNKHVTMFSGQTWFHKLSRCFLYLSLQNGTMSFGNLRAQHPRPLRSLLIDPLRRKPTRHLSVAGWSPLLIMTPFKKKHAQWPLLLMDKILHLQGWWVPHYLP